MTAIFRSIVSIPPPFNMIVIIMILVFGTALVTSLAKQIRKYACHRHDLELERDMLDRGMTVEEIERVVRAERQQPPYA